jgi:hypothetical protein
MNTSDAEDQPQQPDRPLGVAILSIWDGVSVGLIPALRMGIMIASNQNLEDISILTLCISIGLPITIITAALGTFRGNDRARLSLLILLTIYFGLNMFQNVILLVSGGLTPEDQVRISVGFIGAILTVVINLWYFLRPNTISFFRRPVEPRD